jgi:hypothetical protein
MKSKEYEVKALNMLEIGLHGAAQAFATLALVHAIKETSRTDIILK